MGDIAETAASRTSYFAVKDGAVFTEWAKKHELDILKDQDGLYALETDRTWPDFPPVNGAPNNIELELAKHLQEGEAAILLDVRIEEGYLDGWASAVKPNGEVHRISLADIYSWVKTNWPDMRYSFAEY